MDLLFATTTTSLAGTPEEAYRQVRELADKAALVNLSVLYSMAVDDHDLDTVVACFAPDGSFTRLGTTVRGHADLRTFYASMMDRYVTTLHTPESHVAVVDAENKPHRKPITLGIREGANVEVADGLQNGERVVTAGAFELGKLDEDVFDKTKVHIQLPKEEEEE